ncbi:hypothetical protein PSQ40_04720 [Curvibacter sp. HBC61]|uniref:Uncharacterized protein n=1 Tax=Curvibacter cyanobacteriorum TaxID=3026422 RepID=A0ABT5MVM5_9BURK|nr:hypothetical protein [Curvibacter sp. HBC61]MDD0837868.1 hypothetical protein [Curvibacter sp. HBC61]
MVEGLDQLIQAVKSLKSAAPDEYCAFWWQTWATCMTKAEWSGWVQAVGSVAAIYASAKMVKRADQQERRRVAEAEEQERKNAVVTAAQLASAGLLALSRARIIAKTENHDKTLGALCSIEATVTTMKSINFSLFTKYTDLEPLLRGLALLSASVELGAKWAAKMSHLPNAGHLFFVISEPLDMELGEVVIVLRERAGLPPLQRDSDIVKEV